jgi:hypothetical protein
MNAIHRPGDPQAEACAYRHNPRPISAPVSFVLEGDMLSVDTGRKQQEVRLGAVEEVRMTYEPGRLSQRVFRTRVRMVDGKTFTFSSLSWKSLVEAQELGPDYRSFAKSLFQAIARANPKARFVAGQPAWKWVITTGIAAMCFLAMAVLIWRALQVGATGTALLGALFAGIGIWQLEPMVRLNKPRAFSPDMPPTDLMPRS